MYNPWRRPRRRARRILSVVGVVVLGGLAVAAGLWMRHGTRTVPAPAAGLPSAVAAAHRTALASKSPAAAPPAGPAPLDATLGLAPPQVAARSYALVDARSGRVLADSQPNLQIAPASLAKLMTFDLTLKALAAGQIHLGDAVPLGPGVRTLSTTPGLSNMYLDLPPGATVPLHTLMLGMMVASGNDAALAVAEYVGGTDAHFVAMMNAEAAQLGMAHTHFANPEGLAAPGQVTTALDMATLARHIVLTYPTAYRQFTDVATFRWQHITFRNYNHLIGVDAAVTGMKSGYWGGVGYHLVTTAIQGHTELVGVVMGTSGLQVSAQVSQGLLNWGFAHFQDVQISWQRPLPPHGTRVWGARAPSVALRVTAQPWVVVPRAAQPAVPVTSAHLPPYLVAPVRPGQAIGSVQATLAGHVIATAPVVAAGPDPVGGLLTRAWGGFRLWLKHL